ncbi:MAG: FKBP-type peptidyl-prolyl cis-trans isomerase [Planctomycetota bacterium]|nr:FKBP-type peptidyl-prolyl cis-trans isomerase [Planctomycetota bacterium]
MPRRLLLAALGVCLVAPVSGARGARRLIPLDTKIVTTKSGLKYSVLEEGDGGRKPQAQNGVVLHYTFWLVDGTTVTSSRARGNPERFVVGSIAIQGWREGLQLMTKGSRYKFTIPPGLGYGAQKKRGIPANSTLILEVRLLEIVELPTFQKGDPERQKKTESGLTYEVLAAGEGDPPGRDDGLEFKFTYWNEKGQVVATSALTKRLMRGNCNSFRLAFLKELPLLMREGERMWVSVPPELCFRDKAAGPYLPANSVVIWELELVKINRVPAHRKLDPKKTVVTATGLKYEIIAQGRGASPKMGQNVKVHYAGWLTDGTLFDASYARGAAATFRLGEVIAGWNEGLQLMKPGARFLFEIPPDLAYGARGRPKIPGGATLVFMVELIELPE